MFKVLQLLFLCIALFAALGECGLKSWLGSGKVETTTAAPSPYISNNLPPLDEGCVYHFKCSKKLLAPETSANHKPCLKFCLNYLKCDGKKRPVDRKDYCLELNEQIVEEEHKQAIAAEKQDASPVAMIDFPCQPGYLPDSRGRCREVW